MRPFILFFCLCLKASTQTLITSAGQDSPHTQSGSVATETALGNVSQIATDSSGNFYFYDVHQSLLIRTGADGIATVIAGNGRYESTGDGGPAAGAGIKYLAAMTIGGDGSIYFADLDRIRRIAPDGTISTILNGPEKLPRSDAKSPVWGGQILGLALDSYGYLFFSEMPGRRIWRRDPEGSLVVVAGSGEATDNYGDGVPASVTAFGQPQALLFDRDGSLLVSDGQFGRVRRIRPNGTVQTVAGGGRIPRIAGSVKASDAQLNGGVQGLARDASGNLYLLQTPFGKVSVVAPDGTLSLLTGGQGIGFGGDGGPAALGMFGGSQTWTGSIATDGQGNLYLPDGVNGRVRRIDSSGNLTTVAGNGAFWFSGDGGSLSDLRLRAPTAAAFDGAGNLYIADAGNARIRKIGADGTVSTIAGNGSAGPLADDDGGPAIQTSTGTTSAIAADGSGNVYYADGSRIRRVDPAGIVTTMVSGPVNQVEGLAVDGQGNLYFSDENRGVVQMITTDGTLSVIAGAGGELSTPKGLAIGPDGSIYVADPGAQAVRRIAPDRALTTVAGGGIPPATGDGGAATNAFLFAPFGVAVRQDGTLFISESGLGRVRKVASDGTITTVAGKGSNCCRAGLAIADAIGDNGAATDATLSRPAGLALDATGALFIVDTGHNRVRKLVE